MKIFMIQKMTRTIHYCNFCDYKSDRRYDRDKHVSRKHANDHSTPSQAGSGAVQSDQPHSNLKNKHVRKGSMTEDELRNMITESFNVFQDYMKIKMQPTGAGSEEMIEESIHAFKCYMLNQINELIFFIMYLFYLATINDLQMIFK